MRELKINLDHRSKDNEVKNVIIYSRQDAVTEKGGTGRRIVNAAEFTKELSEKLPSHLFRVSHLPSIVALNLTEQFHLFSGASVIVAPHGAWMPNVIYMVDEYSLAPKMAIALEKFSGGKERAEFEMWDHGFKTSKLFTFFGTYKCCNIVEHCYEFWYDSICSDKLKVVNNDGDFNVGDAGPFAKRILENFYPALMLNGSFIRNATDKARINFDRCYNVDPNGVYVIENKKKKRLLANNYLNYNHFLTDQQIASIRPIFSEELLKSIPDA